MSSYVTALFSRAQCRCLSWWPSSASLRESIGVRMRLPLRKSCISFRSRKSAPTALLCIGLTA